MIMCLDVGNSQVYGGVFHDEKIRLRFRRNSKTGASSDEIGIFLRTILRENEIDPKAISQVAICTVVPEALHSIKNACMKYFKLTPFVLQAGVKTGLKVRYKNPLEVGADRIANAIAGTQLYPNQDLVIIDFGTATTFCAITKEKDYLGGVILAGLKISMEALESRTSKLPSVEIVNPEACLGKTTIDSIQSGLYFGTLGQVKEISSRMIQEGFQGSRPKLIGTGGFASLFKNSEIFDEESPDLVLHGLYHALKINS